MSSRVNFIVALTCLEPCRISQDLHSPFGQSMVAKFKHVRLVPLRCDDKKHTYLEFDETFSVFVLDALVLRCQLFLHAAQILPHLGNLSYELLGLRSRRLL